MCLRQHGSGADAHWRSSSHTWLPHRGMKTRTKTSVLPLATTIALIPIIAALALARHQGRELLPWQHVQPALIAQARAQSAAPRFATLFIDMPTQSPQPIARPMPISATRRWLHADPLPHRAPWLYAGWGAHDALPPHDLVGAFRREQMQQRPQQRFTDCCSAGDESAAREASMISSPASSATLATSLPHPSLLASVASASGWLSASAILAASASTGHDGHLPPPMPPMLRVCPHSSRVPLPICMQAQAAVENVENVGDALSYRPLPDPARPCAADNRRGTDPLQQEGVLCSSMFAATDRVLCSSMFAATDRGSSFLSSMPSSTFAATDRGSSFLSAMDRTLREIFLFSFIFSLSSCGAGTSIPFFILSQLSLALAAPVPNAHQGMDRHLTPRGMWMDHHLLNWLALLVGAMMVATLKRSLAAGTSQPARPRRAAATAAAQKIDDMVARGDVSEHTTADDPFHAILHQAALEQTQDASTLSSNTRGRARLWRACDQHHSARSHHWLSRSEP